MTLFRSPFMVGATISLALGVILGILDKTTFGESVLIGMTGTLLSIGLELMARDEFGKLFRSPRWLRSRVARMASAAKSITRRHGDGIPSHVAKTLITDCVSNLEDLRKGRFHSPQYDYQMLVKQTALAQRKMKTSTNVITGDPDGMLLWWLSGAGKGYWEENERALEREVLISRVFIYDQMTPELRNLIDRQAQAGVKVYEIASDAIEARFRLNFVIWDGQATWESRTNADGQQIGHLFTVGDETKVGLLERAHKNLVLSASPVQPAPEAAEAS